VILHDVTNYASSPENDCNNIGKGYIRGNVVPFLRMVQSAADTTGARVKFSYLYHDGSATARGQKSFLAVTGNTDATLLANVADFTCTTSTNHVFTSLADVAKMTTWSKPNGTGDYMRIVVVITHNALATTYALGPLGTLLKDAHIFPYIYVPSGRASTYTRMTTDYNTQWTRITSSPPNWVGYGSVSGKSGTSLLAEAVPVWASTTTSDIALTTDRMLGAAFVYVYPNPPYLFFAPDKNYSTGNSMITISVNDKCYCFPHLHNSPLPPAGFFYCDDPAMPCADAVDSKKIYICHAPNGDLLKANTLIVSHTAFDSSGGSSHGGHPYDGFGGCDCYLNDPVTGEVIGIEDMPPSSLYDMAPDHYYGNVYIFGHDTRKAYVTVPSTPILTQNIRDIYVTANKELIFDFLKSPNMVVDENGYLHNFQLTYIGWTGSGASVTNIPLYSYPDGTPIVISSDYSTGRICPFYNGSGIKLTPPCPPNANTPLQIRYRVCNGCFCSQQGSTDNAGSGLLRIFITCPPNQPPTCATWNMETQYVYPTVGKIITVDLDNQIFDSDNDPVLPFILNSGQQANGNVSTLQAGNIVTYTIKPGASGSGTILFYSYILSSNPLVRSASNCSINIPIVLLRDAPEITITPLTFLTPRETDSTISTIEIKFNPHENVTIFASNGQWPSPGTTVDWVTLDGSVSLFQLGEVLTLETGLTGIVTTTLQWRPDQTYPEGVTSSLTLYVVANVDGTNRSSTPVPVTFRVTPNNPPTAADAAFTIDEDTSLSFTLNCTDPDSYHKNSLTVTNTAPLPSGSLSQVGQEWVSPAYDGTSQNFTFAPTPNFNGVVTFTYTCTDYFAATVTRTVTITVNPVNDPPVSEDYVVFVTEGQTKNFRIDGFDPDSTNVITINSLVVNTLNGPLHYTPTSTLVTSAFTNQSPTNNGNWNFNYVRPFSLSVVNETFTFRVTDGDLTSRIYTVTFVPQAIVPPTCTNAVLNTAEDTPITFSLNGYYASAGGAPLYGVTLQSGLTTANGHIGGALLVGSQVLTQFPNQVPKGGSGLPLSLTYEPVLNAFGTTTFTYFVVDGTYLFQSSPVCTITINVSPVNDPPTLSVTPSSIEVLRGATTPVFTVTVTDVDSNAVSVSWPQSSEPFDSHLVAQNGRLTSTTLIGSFTLVGGTASFTVSWLPGLYTPGGSTGFVNFTAEDSSLLDSVPGNVLVTFRTPANEPPFHVTQNVPVINEDTQTCTVITFDASDPNLADRNLVEYTIIRNTGEGTLNVTTLDGWESGRASGTNTRFSVCYIPNPNFNGQDFFIVRYRDPLLLNSTVDTRININVVPVNDPPTSSNISFVLAVNSTFNFTIIGSDIDGDSLSLCVNADIGPLVGSVFRTSTEVTGAQCFPQAAISEWLLQYVAPPVNVVENFTFRVYDGSLYSPTYYVMIQVLGQIFNDPPETYPAELFTDEDTSLWINLDHYSWDNESQNQILLQLRDPISPSTIGTLRLPSGSVMTSSSSLQPTENHTIEFRPTEDYCSGANFTFSLRAFDNYSYMSNTSAIKITVVCVNDPPIISVAPADIRVHRGEPGAFTFTVTDVDSLTVNITLTAEELSFVPQGSTLTIGGTVVNPLAPFSILLQNPNLGQPITVPASWLPNPLAVDGTSGNFTSFARDVEGLFSGPAFVSLSVIDNVPPVAYNQSITVDEDASVVITLIGTDVDIGQSSTLTAALVLTPDSGSLSSPLVNVTSLTTQSEYRVTYTPDVGFFGSDVFTYTVTDVIGAVSNIGYITITVNHVNHAPTCGRLSTPVYVQAGFNVSFSLTGRDVDLNDGVVLQITDFDLPYGNLTGPDDNPAGLGSTYDTPRPWLFNYNTSVGEDGNFSMTYIITDNYQNPLSSVTCTVLFYVSVGVVIIPNEPPVVRNETIIIDEDSEILINLEDYINDPDGDIITELLFNSFPNGSLVNLFTPDGTPLTSSVLVPNVNGGYPVVLHLTPNQNGNTTFSIIAYDSDGGVSIVPGFINIVIRPVNDPPTITVDPTSLTLERLQTGSIDFTINDIDSTELNVSIVLNTVSSLSTFVFGSSDTVVASETLPQIYTHTSGSLPDTQTDYLSWTPGNTIPDNTVSTFQLRVTDGALSADSSLVYLFVVSNNIPYTLLPDAPIGATMETPLPIELVGSDDDDIHRQTLTVHIGSLPSHGTLTIGGVPVGVPVVVDDPLSTAAPYIVLTVNGTSADVVYTSDYLYLGQDSFTFYVIDGVGAVSLSRTVIIDVNVSIDHPPEGSSVILRVDENTCLFGGNCTVSLNPDSVQLFASDPDGDVISITFLDVGDPAKGTLAYFDGTNMVALHDNDTISLLDSTLYYQPAPGQFSVDPNSYDVATFSVVTADDVATPYTVTIFVDPVNDPPVGMDDVVTLNMNENATYTFYYADPDDPVENLTISIVEIPASNKGRFYHPINNTVELYTEVLIGDQVVFVPWTNAYDESAPIASISYQVTDDEGAESPVYTIRFLVGFVPLNITYKEDRTLLTDEDLPIYFMVDRYNVDYFGGNPGLTAVNVSISNVVIVGSGTFFVCDPVATTTCTEILPGVTTIEIVPGSTFRFQDGPNENGNGRLTFDLTLTPKTGAPPITVGYVVNVLPVNDPPVLVPGFHEPLEELKNEIDEDTYYVLNFTATDIDSSNESISGILVDIMRNRPQAVLYLCDGNASDPNAVHYDDCIAGTRLNRGSIIPPYNASLALFKFVVVPAPNATLDVRLLLRVEDDWHDYSQAKVAQIDVLPINDPPYFDEEKTSVTIGLDNQGELTFRVHTSVHDWDFPFGFNVTLTVTAVNSTDGYFVLQNEYATDCDLVGEVTIICTGRIERISSIATNGFLFYPNSSVVVMFDLEVNDNGNEDKWYRPLAANITLVAEKEVESLVGTTKTQDNTVLIVAPIAGLLAGVGIAALIFIIRGRKSQKDVESYFDHFALGLEGVTNASPLYVEAKKGGESPLYTHAASQ